ncbi:MAG: hypothetical protein ACFFHD_12090 [Promethearchaeota archaeon]
MGEQIENKKIFLKKDAIILRSYPKAIFFTPLFVISIIFWIIQTFLATLNPWLGGIWVIIFFSNFAVSSLDFPSGRFLIIVLGTLIIVLLLIFFGLIPTLTQLSSSINLGLPAEFYMLLSIILGIILGLVILSSRFDYYKIERNEIFHKKGIYSSNIERFPVRGLRIKKEIPDIFEYLMFRTGSLTLIFSKGEIVHLNTVLNIKKKAEQIDFLLSSLQVMID